MRLATYLLASAALTLGLSGDARAGEPGFVVEARADGAEVLVRTEAGVHVNPDAPVALTGAAGAQLTGAAREDDGDAAWHLATPLAAGERVRLDFALCDDALTWCRFYKIAFDFDPSTLAQSTFQGQGAAASPAPTGNHPGLMPFAIQDDADAAFARAQDEGKLVLIDFYAVWCPPCQQLAAEGMADAEVRAVVDELVVLQLDADRPSSWNAKGRYGVRGYPTVILAKSNGQEVARLEGYPGLKELRRWITTSTQAGHSLEELAQMRAEGDRGPEVLTALARQLGDRGLDEEAVRMWREALPLLSGSDEVDARVALVRDAASRGDKKEVKAQLKAFGALDPDIRVAYGLYDAAQSVPEGQAKLGDQIAQEGLRQSQRLADAPGLTPLERADAWDGVASFDDLLGDEAGAKAASSRTADAYLEALAAQPGAGAARFDAFRGPARGLTSSLRAAGRMDEAEALHKELVAAYPDEVTYFYDYARFLKAGERMEEAEVQARAAVAHAHGDNLLWSTTLLADILVANGKPSEAAAAIQDALANTPVPDDPTIRTHRYVDRLKTQLDAIQSGGQAAR